jgi:hypothetical protein
LTAPGAALSLQAALGAMASLSPPALNLPPASLASLLGILAALANINSGLGVNLLAPNAAASLEMAIGALPLAALANLSLAASAQAAIAANAGAAAAADLAAAASLEAALAPLSLAAMGGLAMAANLTMQLGAPGLPMLTVSCPICKFL